MLVLFSYFLVLCYSSCLYETTDYSGVITTKLTYGKYSTCSSLVEKTTSLSMTNFKVFKKYSKCHSKELIIDFHDLNYLSDEKLNLYYNVYGATVPYLDRVIIKPYNLVDAHIYVNGTNNNTRFEIERCSYCWSADNYYLYAFSQSFTATFDLEAIDSTNLCYYNDNSMNVNGYPYIFIDAKISLTLKLTVYGMNSYDLNYFNSLSGSLYLLTTSNIEVYFNSFIYKTLSGSSYQHYGLTSLSVCSRKDIDRNVFFNLDHTPYTNCSCWTKNNDTEITVDSMFNYPDCIHNSSAFDLVLPSSSTTYSISNTLIEWYSIVFTAPSQSIKIGAGRTLTIDELNLNQESISFNGMVYAKNLIVTKTGASFKTLNFDSIDYEGINVNEVLFTISYTLTNLTKYGLKLCEKSVVLETTSCEGSSSSESSTQQESSSQLIEDSSSEEHESSSQIIKESSSGERHESSSQINEESSSEQYESSTQIILESSSEQLESSSTSEINSQTETNNEDSDYENDYCPSYFTTVISIISFY